MSKQIRGVSLCFQDFFKPGNTSWYLSHTIQLCISHTFTVTFHLQSPGVGSTEHISVRKLIKLLYVFVCCESVFSIILTCLEIIISLLYYLGHGLYAVIF